MPAATKDQIVEILETIARLLELKGENPFKIRAYTNAARTLETTSASADMLCDPEKLRELPGIGEAIAEKISILAKTGKLPFYEELRREFPATIFELFDLQGLGAKKIKVLYETLKVHSNADLEKACKDGRVAKLAGFGEKTALNILQALEQRKTNQDQFLFGEIAPLAKTMLADLRNHPDVTLAEIAGSYRRRKEIVRDLDFIVCTKNPDAVGKYFTETEFVAAVLAKGDTKCSVMLRQGIQCDLRMVKQADYPFALTYFTGSKEHNIRLRNRALQHGWSLNEYRFSIAEGKKKHDPIPKVHDERELYAALGLDFVPPELREDLGEFDAAENHGLPRLVELENLRGTFHCHTKESDGRNSLEEMAAAAQELGLEYLGIADHSKSSFQAHGLDEKRLAKQIREIHKLNETFDGFRLFAGIECDILKDGALDFSDDVLASLDYVVASVHNSFTLGEAEMTKRIIAAISNPHVTMLGHLTGRILLRRPSYAVNIPAVIEAAAETKTIIEINASPYRLDMDWRWWPLAKEKGVRSSINPDAHSTEGLQDLYFGIGVARKGWLTKKEIVNCLPLAKVEKELDRKRKRIPPR